MLGIFQNFGDSQEFLGFSGIPRILRNSKDFQEFPGFLGIPGILRSFWDSQELLEFPGIPGILKNSWDVQREGFCVSHAVFIMRGHLFAIMRGALVRGILCAAIARDVFIMRGNCARHFDYARGVGLSK